jgi:N-ethylmaleimide reductase
MKPSLFDPLVLGEIPLANRIVMAPMTRNRAGDGDAPTELNAEYYRQRASTGLIVSEGIQPSRHGKGYFRTPGLYTKAQIAGWRRVTDAVRAGGGRIVAQLLHCGRIGAAVNKDDDAETVAPSAIRADVEVWADGVKVPADAPRALALAEIPLLIDEYARAGRSAVAAGFDGVELHCGSGYLPMQFLSTGTNRRTDRYGGSVRNRIRFVVDVLEALAAELGPDRVGFRMTPGSTYNAISDEDPVETHRALLQAASPLGLAWLHVVRENTVGIDAPALARRHFPGALILGGGYDAESAQQALDSGRGEAVSFGRALISNPDLVRRLREGLPLTEIRHRHLFGGGAEGYTDYPAHG